MHCSQIWQQLQLLYLENLNYRTYQNLLTFAIIWILAALVNLTIIVMHTIFGNTCNYGEIAITVVLATIPMFAIIAAFTTIT